MGKVIDNPHLLVDIAYSAIKEDILNKYLVPGKKIVVRELSERYDISGTPIKQALNRFITEGLVESIPRRGVYVKKFTYAELKEMNQMRSMMELYAVPFIIAKSETEPEYVRALEKSIDEFERQLSDLKPSNNISEVCKADFKFHLLLVNSLNNKMVNEIYDRMVTQTAVLFYVYGKRIERLRESLNEHKAILRALKDSNKEDAEEAIREHFNRTTQDWKENLS